MPILEIKEAVINTKLGSVATLPLITIHQQEGETVEEVTEAYRRVRQNLNKGVDGHANN